MNDPVMEVEVKYLVMSTHEELLKTLRVNVSFVMFKG